MAKAINPHNVRDSNGRFKSVVQLVNPVTAAPVSVKNSKNLNVIALLIDSSGSMAECVRAKAIEKFWQDQVGKIKQEAWEHKDTQDTLVYYSMWDEHNLNVEGPFVPESVPYAPSFFARGGTPLCAIVNTTYDKIRASHPGAQVLILTVTDGEENQSGWSHTNKFKQLQSNLDGSSTFAFVGPRGCRNQLTTWGVLPGNVQECDGDARELRDVVSVRTVNAVGAYYTASAAGATASQSFFLDVAPVAATLDTAQDERSKFKRLAVDKTEPIADFMKRRVGTYDLGNVFYQLTKTEKVQPHKKFAARNKKTGKIVFDNLRTILNVGPTATVKPGNFGDWEVFVTSTSMNRKLIESTYVLQKVA